MGVKQQITFMVHLFKLEFATAMQYRLNFIFQSIGMMLNDVFWLVFWFLLFERFGSIGTWTLDDMLLLYAVLTTGFGLVHGFFGNTGSLATMIENGQLDYYLTLPKNLLLHSMIKVKYASFGDFMFGIVLALVVLPVHQLPLYAVLACSSALILGSWALLANCGAFFIARFETAAKTIKDTLLIFSGYPFSVYSGWVKAFLLFVLPVGMVIGVPVELLNTFNLKWFLIVLGFSLGIFILAVSVFYLGLRKYSSGNMMVMRG